MVVIFVDRIQCPWCLKLDAALNLLASGVCFVARALCVLARVGEEDTVPCVEEGTLGASQFAPVFSG